MPATKIWAWLREICKKWYPVLAFVFYLWELINLLAIPALILAVPALLVTLIVNAANISPKDLSSFAEPLGNFLGTDTYIILLKYRWPITIACSSAVLLAISAFYTRLRIKWQSMRCLDDILREYRDFLDALRSFTLKSIEKRRMDDSEYTKYINEISADMETFLITSANRMSVLFQSYTRSRCHVSVKLFDPETSLVRTVARDEMSPDNRSSVDENMDWYPYQNNTAFQSILDDKTKSRFVSNHLRVLHLLRKYKNGNPEWKNLYTACVVVPITKNTHANTINRTSVLGFLCVDNRSGGFDKKVCPHLLQSLARLYHFVLIAASAAPKI